MSEPRMDRLVAWQRLESAQLTGSVGSPGRRSTVTPATSRAPLGRPGEVSHLRDMVITKM